MVKKKDSLRPPIVVILGHVDHGKTTLLDAIRETNVAGKEAGGITQSIGASQVTTTDGKKITFIDTPGHSVFSQMRSHGAKLADIAVLVVAGDDGVKPQTKEALGYIKDEGVPFIVAITKMDLPSANVEKCKSQLTKEGVKFEGQGGDTPVVSLSAKTKKGVTELLEMILLVAEVKGVTGNPEGKLEGAVIETNKDKRGPVVSAIVSNGTIGIGDEIVAEGVHTKVRGLFNYLSKPVKEAVPGDPVEILGFSKLPPVGAPIVQKSEAKEVLETADRKVEVDKKDSGEIPVVIKAKSEGVLADLLSNIPEGVRVVQSSIGDVVQKDVFEAKSSTLTKGSQPARIFAFESKVSSSIAKLAETEGVMIERFEIIYKLFERLEELVAGTKEKILGKAEIVASFPYDNKQVAGCKVTSGRIDRSDKLVVVRKEERLGRVKIVSMRKGKEKIDKAESGEEFGIIFAPQLDFKVGDVILSVTK